MTEELPTRQSSEWLARHRRLQIRALQEGLPSLTLIVLCVH